MRFIKLVFLISFFIKPLNLNSQIWGPGAGTCEVFNSQTESLQMNYYSWAQGFMGAVSVGLGQDITKGYSQIFLQKWLKDFCSKNPLKYYSDGVMELVVKNLLKKTESNPTNFSSPLPKLN